MKKIRNLFLVLLFLFLGLGITDVQAKEKVKVYIFEAGGCPYCEAQVEYLEGLDSYGKKFEVIIKELYVDHINWEQGKDYELGRKVAEAFQSAGFSEASYNGTPFVVISDIYAVTSYSTELESVIDKAYEIGDKDVVSCIERGRNNCLAGANQNDYGDTTTYGNDTDRDNTTTDNNGDTSLFAASSSSDTKSESNILIILLVVFLSMSVIINVVLIILLAKKK